MIRNTHRQRGAALIIGLMMLVVITLLAVTAVNTASTELVMAGNEQFRERAFQAADAGVERAVATIDSVPQTATPTTGSGTILPLPWANAGIAAAGASSSAQAPASAME